MRFWSTLYLIDRPGRLSESFEGVDLFVMRLSINICTSILLALVVMMNYFPLWLVRRVRSTP